MRRHRAPGVTRQIHFSRLTHLEKAYWLALTTLLLAATSYRAATQSVTYDEAFTHNWVLVGPISHVFTYYNANNHVLFSLLAKLSISAFGLSPLSLRLPSICAGMIYLWTLKSFAEMMSLRGLMGIIAASALALNPYVLDFFVAARGYGLALALFALALCGAGRLLTADHERSARQYLAVALPLALSVTANLTFVFPGTALALITSALCLCWRTGERGVRAEARQLVGWFYLPGVLTTMSILAVPLKGAARGHFWFGTNRFGETISSLVEASLRHHPTYWTDTLLVASLASTVSTAAVPGALMLTLGTWALVTRPCSGAAGERAGLDRLVLLVTGVLWLTVLLLMLGHYLFALAYPFMRTGLYLVFLFTLALAGLIAALNARQGWTRALARSGGMLLAVLALHYSVQFNVSHFREWRYDAGTKEIFHIISEYAKADGSPLRLASSRWTHGPALNFYRALHPGENIAEVVDDWEPGRWDYEFFVLQPGSDVQAAAEVATLLFTHPTSGTVLLINNRGGLIREFD